MTIVLNLYLVIHIKLFNFILIRHIGLYGAAIATGITQFISLMISNLFFGETGREVFKWQLKGLNPLAVISRNY